ncbi:hypothetical protein [Tunturiibacter gelidoferens]|uniref:Uncharacterized protein n=1 Tax=Tunturiibacter gelidiferens TaxID=3069689 RepID=A0A9X0QD51_9BACT|nr:hypothetical protein [Edaphobacter lichenicola]MBB5328093.1 hypothetical protein [Edaphobacter lichenicola]
MTDAVSGEEISLEDATTVTAWSCGSTGAETIADGCSCCALQQAG